MQKVRFEDLSPQQVNDAWAGMQKGPMYVVLKHAFDKRIAEAKNAYDTISKDDFDNHKGFIRGLTTQSNLLDKSKPPTE